MERKIKKFNINIERKNNMIQLMSPIGLIIRSILNKVKEECNELSQ